MVQRTITRRAVACLGRAHTMTIHHRHKQRILTTIVTLIAFTIALDAFIILSPRLESSVALLFSFTIAIGLVTAYQCYNYRHSHEHTTIVNTLTQVFLGAILFATAVVMLLLNAFFGFDVIDSYLALSVIVILLVFLFIKQFDQFLEREIGSRFPMGSAPAPRPAAAPMAVTRIEPVKSVKKKR